MTWLRTVGSAAVALLAVFAVVFGCELIWWAPYRISAAFQPARAETAALTAAIHLHALDVWGLAFLAVGALLGLVFHPKLWRLGAAGALLGTFISTFLAYTFIQAAGMTDYQGVPHGQPHSGLAGGTTSALLALMYAAVFVAACHDHVTAGLRRRRAS